MGQEIHLSARQKALDLAKRKDAIEGEMDAIYESLSMNNGPGLQGNLVDAEGFPRADIDVVHVRHQRQRFAVLKTDLTSVSTEMEKLMHIALAPRSTSDDAQEADAADPSPTTSIIPSRTTEQPSSSPAGPAVTVPPTARSAPSPHETRQAFALVDMVSSSSPSATAGLLVNDRIIAFGAISLRSSSTASDAISALPGLLRSHENRPVDVIVRRGDTSSTRQIVTLSLTPRRWQGNGLLGCHVVPLRLTQVDETYAPDVATAVASRPNTLPGQN